MKKTFILASLAIALFSCKKQEQQPTEPEVAVTYSTFGEEITADKAVLQDEMLDKFQNLKEGDTIPIKFKSTIRSEEHTSELQSRENLVCRLLLEKKK